VKWIRTLLWMIIFFCVILLSIQNADDVTLRFGLYPILTLQWFEKRVPLFVVLLCSLFVGVLIGGLSDAYGRYQLRKTLRQNQKTIEELRQEINALRSPPLDESPLWGKKT
jgi:uncharacterized integral membrane protein